MYYNKRNEEKVKELHPLFQAKVREWLAILEKRGKNVLITDGYRSIEEQNRLFQQGRNGNPGAIVTNARGGESSHQYRIAIDFVPCESNGKLLWGRKTLFVLFAELAKKLGMKSGKDWKSFPDLPHLELAHNLTLRDLQSGKTIS